MVDCIIHGWGKGRGTKSKKYERRGKKERNTELTLLSYKATPMLITALLL